MTFDEFLARWPVFSFYDKEHIINTIELIVTVCNATQVPFEAATQSIADRLSDEIGRVQFV